MANNRVDLSLPPNENFLEVLRATKENEPDQLTEGAAQILESVDKGEFTDLDTFLNEHPEVNGSIDEEALEE
ncbi:hypothetical protein SP15_268 [Bacillus phage SP-15]|uniref:Uncharacterized protein n=1 Tax=Bacillus phage SP-15 TaxID=1792032 RepID=A0A127AWP8_9CAUD|nr:hypothetical protein SP15_268 [Bacillus phage SP-15]AMM45075.1 hypothetical protein SP15_268 [Bacillus phage SP-15]